LGILDDCGSFVSSFICGSHKRLVFAAVSLRIYGVVGFVRFNALVYSVVAGTESFVEIFLKLAVWVGHNRSISHNVR
jgi:hypothetical protein